jgi:hypothetical protein
MTREQAERERERLAVQDPNSTWLLHEAEPGEWSVARVGLRPQHAQGSHTEGRPKPPDADDPRPAMWRNVGGPWVGS